MTLLSHCNHQQRPNDPNNGRQQRRHSSAMRVLPLLLAVLIVWVHLHKVANRQLIAADADADAAAAAAEEPVLFIGSSSPELRDGRGNPVVEKGRMIREDDEEPITNQVELPGAIPNNQRKAEAAEAKSILSEPAAAITGSDHPAEEEAAASSAVFAADEEAQRDGLKKKVVEDTTITESSSSGKPPQQVGGREKDNDAMSHHEGAEGRNNDKVITSSPPVVLSSSAPMTTISHQPVMTMSARPVVVSARHQPPATAQPIITSHQSVSTGATIMPAVTTTTSPPQDNHPNKSSKQQPKDIQQLAATPTTKIIHNNQEIRVCSPWELSLDDFWQHHPDWHVSYENETHTCLSPFHDPKKAKFFRQLYQQQWNSTCQEVAVSHFDGFGLGSQYMIIYPHDFFANYHDQRPFTIVSADTYYRWPYAPPYRHNKNNTRNSWAACPSQDAWCYFLPISNCNVEPGTPPAYTGNGRPNRKILKKMWNKQHPESERLVQQHDWMSEYMMRPNQKTRHQLYKYIQTHAPTLSTAPNCTWIHVRRGDAQTELWAKRNFYPISQYLQRGKINPKDGEVVLLTDDEAAIEEALLLHPQYQWKFFRKTRNRGVQTMHSHFPTKDAALEMLTILAEMQVASQCQKGVFGESKFPLLIQLAMTQKHRKEDMIGIKMDARTRYKTESATLFMNDLEAKLERARKNATSPSIVVAHEKADPVSSTRRRTTPKEATPLPTTSWKPTTEPPTNTTNTTTQPPTPPRVIAYSLYGNQPRYIQGMVNVAKRSQVVYPHWEIWIYHDHSVPKRALQTLNNMTQVQLLNVEDSTLFPSWVHATLSPSTWRFLVASNETVDAYAIRDSDSLPSAREFAAVQEWLMSNKSFHILRDHPWHHPTLSCPILAGMWGGRSRAVPQMDKLLQDYYVHQVNQNRRHEYGLDQDFLWNVVLPLVYQDVLQHDSYNCREANAIAFPLTRKESDADGNDPMWYVGNNGAQDNRIQLDGFGKVMKRAVRRYETCLEDRRKLEQELGAQGITKKWLGRFVNTTFPGKLQGSFIESAQNWKKRVRQMNNSYY